MPENKLLVFGHVANDWLGYVLARFSIVTEGVAQQASPVVYFDTDVLFNAPSQKMFIDIACSDRLTAPVEHFSKLAISPSVGAELLQLDNIYSSGVGFNFGTYGVPNLRDHGVVLQLIRDLVVKYINKNGRDSLPWLDQAAANYVSCKYAGFDTSILTRYVRYGFTNDAYVLGALTGLVHFWGIPRKQRLEPMRHYLRLLEENYVMDTSNSHRGSDDLMNYCGA